MKIFYLLNNIAFPNRLKYKFIGVYLWLITSWCGSLKWSPL